VDRILASLLINYVSGPERVLLECGRMLRPGGQLVMSGMRRDADVSRICLAGLSELQRGRARTILAAQGEERLGHSLRDFISSGGELLDLESEGLFRFWDGEELAQMLRDAGFEDVETETAYGSPPQATIVSGRRP
jgi:ubiquinone/menaquinone biosynthesis C-methylase UbiE